MDNVTAIDGLTTSLRAVAEITKAMKDISDASLIPTKIYELATEIMTAQSCALAVQSEICCKTKSNLQRRSSGLKHGTQRNIATNFKVSVPERMLMS